MRVGSRAISYVAALRRSGAFKEACPGEGQRYLTSLGSS
jgi:hypothetical protein